MNDPFLLIVRVIVLIWGIIGSCFGIRAVYEIRQDVKKRGHNAASLRALDMEYGGEGSTFMSLYFFPFFFCLIIWPLILLGIGDNTD